MQPSSLPSLVKIIGVFVMLTAIAVTLVALVNMGETTVGFDEPAYDAVDYMRVVATVGLTPLALGAIAAVLGKVAEREEARPPEGTGR